MGKTKVFLVRCAFLIFLAGMFMPVQAAAETTVVITPAQKAVAPGDLFTVNVTITPGEAIAGAQFNLSFDPSALEITGVSEGNLLKQGGANTYFSPGVIDNTAGTLRGVVGAITTPGGEVAGAGAFATVTFKAKAQGSTDLTLSNVIVGNKAGQAVAITVSSGAVNVVQPKGDVNGDGKVNLADAILTLKVMAGMNPAGIVTNYPTFGADVNGDGKIGLAEVIYILQTTAGMR